MGRDRSKFSYGIPGGRAYYRGKDAYAAQSFENETRAEQASGYIKAVLQYDLSVTNGTTATIPWTTSSASRFTKAMTLSGWGYSASTSQFTCQRGGLYRVSFSFQISNAAAADKLTYTIPISRKINDVATTYTLQVIDTASGTNLYTTLSGDLEFQSGDLFSVQVTNGAAAPRTLAGLSGAGTSAEVQATFFNLWQVDG